MTDAADTDRPLPTADELRERLTPLQYEVTQEEGTERPFTGEYWDTKDPGTYHCIVCDEPLFRSDVKYESGTGWPSCWEAIDLSKVRLLEDRSLLMSQILDNLTALDTSLRGRSGNLQNMLEVFHSIFTPLVTRLEEFLALVELGAIEFTQIGETVDLLARIGLGATDRHDDFIRRTDESYADPAPVIEAYRRLPGILGGINALIPTSDPQLQCTAGGAPVPIQAEVLLQGRNLVVCREDR